MWKQLYRGFSDITIAQRVAKLQNMDRLTISRTMTLLESTLPSQRKEGILTLKKLISAHKQTLSSTIRVGLCGPPGAGKSSIISKLGLHICNSGEKLAVLAIDPSSQKSGGALLGDKTRMDELSVHENAYIRPSPSKGILGGVALNTSELIVLCENVGYNNVIIESVGLGQSEIEIDNVADFVIYIIPPGSGDSLQGAKKGIMEIADLIVISKFDGELEGECRRVKRDVINAIQFQMPRYEKWSPDVILTSSMTDHNIPLIWDKVREFTVKCEMDIKKKRVEQNLNNMWQYISNLVMYRLKDDDAHKYTKILSEIKCRLSNDMEYLPNEGAERLLGEIFDVKQ